MEQLGVLTTVMDNPYLGHRTDWLTIDIGLGDRVVIKNISFFFFSLSLDKQTTTYLFHRVLSFDVRPQNHRRSWWDTPVHQT